MMKNMKVYEAIISYDKNDVKAFLGCLRDFGKKYEIRCDDCDEFTIIHLSFKRNRYYEKFCKALAEVGYHIEKKRFQYINELCFRVV